MSRGPLAFDKLLLGYIGLSHAVCDEAAVPQQKKNFTAHVPTMTTCTPDVCATTCHTATQRDGKGQRWHADGLTCDVPNMRSMKLQF